MKRCLLKTHGGANKNLLGTSFGAQNGALGTSLKSA